MRRDASSAVHTNDVLISFFSFPISDWERSVSRDQHFQTKKTSQPTRSQTEFGNESEISYFSPATSLKTTFTFCGVRRDASSVAHINDVSISFFSFPISDWERSVLRDQHFQTKKQVNQLVPKLSLGTRVKTTFTFRGVRRDASSAVHTNDVLISFFSFPISDWERSVSRDQHFQTKKTSQPTRSQTEFGNESEDNIHVSRNEERRIKCWHTNDVSICFSRSQSPIGNEVCHVINIFRRKNKSTNSFPN